MAVPEKDLKDLLVNPGYVSEDDFSAATAEAERKRKNTLDVVLDKGLIRDEQLGQLIAQKDGFKFINLRKEKIDEEILNLIPEVVAESRGIIAFARDGRKVRVGMIDPGDLEMRHILAKRFGRIVEPYLITERDFRQALARYQVGLKEEFGAVFAHLNNPSLEQEKRDALSVKIVDLLLRYGKYNRASDIHLEPLSGEVAVRFRIDGVMHTVLKLPKNLLNIILTRIKIMAEMRTDEHRAAQDGKFRFRADKENMDVRVSIIPVTEGENVVMRLLSAGARRMSLSALGLSADDLIRVKRAVKRPHGMILVTGPTGCGKTTTVYEILKTLNTDKVHIASIEDPVEYDIEGVSQIQVNPKTNLTFAQGLRAIVRQDPDIILVGEIRDRETAGIAVNSAMTGHLVLSTVHANDAAATLPRLLDMGVEPYLLSSTISLIISQRLVRMICLKCRYSYELSKADKAVIADNPRTQEIIAAKYKNEVRLYKGAGCKVCANTGYSGRQGIFEILEITEKIRNLISGRAASNKILAVAADNGMTTILEDGIEKALNGITTLEEVIRTTRE